MLVLYGLIGITEIFVTFLCVSLKSHRQLMPYGEGVRFKVSSDRLEKLGVKQTITGLQGKWFVHYTTVAPISIF